MNRAIRKLRKQGDISGLLTHAAADETQRAEVLTALLEIGEDRPGELRRSRDGILAAVREWTHDPDPEVRAGSLGFVAMLRDGSAGTAIVGALSDPDPRVRVRGLMGVFHLQPPGCLDRVLALLRDTDPIVRTFAAVALERSGDSSSHLHLAEAVDREEDPDVRARMTEVLEILEGRRPPTPIEPFLED